MKKIMSVLMLAVLFTGQIGCSKPLIKQVSAPLNEVQFGRDHKYTVKMKNGRQTAAIDGDKIHATSNELLIDAKQKKILMGQDIKQIEGVRKKRDGSFAVDGLKVGAGFGALTAGLMFGSFGRALAVDGWEAGSGKGNGDAATGFITGFLIGSLVGGAGGGLLGLGIGALIPKHNKIQITPIIEPTANGINAGANLGVKF